MKFSNFKQNRTQLPAWSEFSYRVWGDRHQDMSSQLNAGELVMMERNLLLDGPTVNWNFSCSQFPVFLKLVRARDTRNA